MTLYPLCSETILIQKSVISLLIVLSLILDVPFVVFYSSHFLQPEYISDPLTSVANIPGRSILRASSCDNLVVPRTHRRIGDRAFSVAAPRAWNRLSTKLKLLRSTDSFRRDLKTFVFDSVYGHQDTD